MKDRHRLFVAYVSLIIFSIIGTAASKFLKLDPGPVAPASGFCLILCGACIVGLELGSWQGAIAPLLVGAVSEILGLYTGFPFGRYEYTGTWWPSIPIGGGHLFPLLLPFAWLMTAGGSYLAIRKWISGWGAVFGAAVLAALIDAPMERAMVSVFHYWRWIQPGPVFGAPLANTAGWFGVSLIALTIVDRKAVGRESSQYSGRILGLFCIFASVSGLFAFPDIAWFLLAGYGFVLTLSKRF